MLYFKNRLFETNPFKKFFPFFKEYPYNKLSKKTKKYLIITAVMCFIFCEILLRMFFEFLIAYMQIRNTLVG